MVLTTLHKVWHTRTLSVEASDMVIFSSRSHGDVVCFFVRVATYLYAMDFFETTCGHCVRIRPVQQSGGPQEGKWQLRLSGPSITLQCGFKCLYSEANLSCVNDTVAAYLGVYVADLRKPPTSSQILLGLDVETSDWDEQCSFTRQDEHFEAGFPCFRDHRAVAGHICATGYTGFGREQPVQRPKQDQ